MSYSQLGSPQHIGRTRLLVQWKASFFSLQQRLWTCTRLLWTTHPLFLKYCWCTNASVPVVLLTRPFFHLPSCNLQQAGTMIMPLCLGIWVFPKFCWVPQKNHWLLRNWVVSMLPSTTAQSQIPTRGKARGVPEGTEELGWVTSMWWHGITVREVEDLSGLQGTVPGFLWDTEFSQLHLFAAGTPDSEFALHRGRHLWSLIQGTEHKTGEMPFTVHPVSYYVTLFPSVRSWHEISSSFTYPWWAPV